MSSSETASSYSLCFPVRRTKKVLTAFTLFGCSTSTGVANIYLRHDASVHLQEKSREKSFKKISPHQMFGDLHEVTLS